MEFCLSCLGLAQDSQDAENPETSRLLSSNDPYRSYNGDRPYRAHGQMQAHYLPQQDPETLRRDREAFESICHAMSDEVVDVFTAAPNQGGFGSRVQSMDQLHIVNRAKPLTNGEESSETQGDDEQDDELDPTFEESKPPVPEEMAYRSVRKMPKEVAASTETDKEEDDVAEGAMG